MSRREARSIQTIWPKTGAALSLIVAISGGGAAFAQDRPSTASRPQSAGEAAFEPITRAIAHRMIAMSCEMATAIALNGEDRVTRDEALDAIAVRYEPVVRSFIADLEQFAAREGVSLPAEDAERLHAHMTRVMPQMRAMIPMVRDRLERGLPVHEPGDCDPT